MARPLRPLVAGGVYHVMSRGNEKAPIFLDTRDHLGFLERLDRTVSRFGWRCFSYCLMVNHFHLLLQTPQPNLSRGMQYLQLSYAQFHNKRHDRWGHLFGGRFKSPLVQQDEHLLEAFRYIALNPVRAALCKDPRDWRWSAHAALIGQAPSPAFLDVAGALAWFGDSQDAAAYASFVNGPGAMNYQPRGAVIGDEEYKRSVLPPRRPSREIPQREWGGGRPPLAEIFERSTGAEAVAIAYRCYGYALSAIAEHLGCDVRTAGRWLGRYEDGMSEC